MAEQPFATLSTARCWICGDTADSGEHIAKKSDIQAIFGSVSQSDPLIFNNRANKNRRIGSFNADIIKWERMLCHACNTSRTQAHDRAWATMSNGLRNWAPPLAPGRVIRADRIFPMNTARAMLDCHLYFAKAFGCLVVKAADQTAQIDSGTFARAISSSTAHPHLYLAIGVPPKLSAGPVVSASDPMILKDPRDGSAALMTWFYNVDGVCVLVAYAPNMPMGARKEGLWHPRDGHHRLVVKDFRELPKAPSE